jgi:hypothetical protein
MMIGQFYGFKPTCGHIIGTFWNRSLTDPKTVWIPHPFFSPAITRRLRSIHNQGDSGTTSTLPGESHHLLDDRTCTGHLVSD